MPLSRKVLTLVFLPAWALCFFFLERAVTGLLSALPGMTGGSPLASALQFFLYETPKVLLLLTLVVFAVGVVRSYFSPGQTRRMLQGKPALLGNAMASTLGIVTPFCSCSAVPLFIGFVEAGIPVGITLSFLIAAPMINEVAVVLLFGLFGWRTAILYVAMGLLIATASGFVLGRFRAERYVEAWVFQVRAGNIAMQQEQPGLEERLAAGFAAVREIVARVWWYVVIGIGVGACIHGYVPQDALASLMGKSAWWAVPVAVLIGIPLYSNAAGIIPIILALLEKGASLGTALAFMMSVIGLSFPEMIILRKVLKVRLILLFAGIVGAGIVVVGYVFNLIF